MSTNSYKQQLEEIANNAENNQNAIKNYIISAVNSKSNTNLPNNISWNDIGDAINNIDTTRNLIIQYGDLEPYYETVQGNGWSKTLEANISCIKVNTLGDMSVYVSDINNNLYKFDTNGNQIWKNNVGYNVKFIRCDINGNIYITGQDNNNYYGAFKYNSSGVKIFTYINFSDKYINPICINFDDIHNQAFLLCAYSLTNPSGYTSNQKWITYDSSNNIIMNVLLLNALNIYPHTGIILESGELICTSFSSTTNGIMKFNTSGQKTNNYEWTSDYSGSFNIMSNNHIFLINYNVINTTMDNGKTSISILDINLNILQTQYNNDNSYLMTNDNEDTKFVNDTTYICNNINSNYLNMINFDINNNTANIYKSLQNGTFDYDNKYLYYSKYNTNILSKINFDADFTKSQTINKSDASGHAYVIDDIPVCDSKNNIYILSGYSGNYYDPSAPNRIFKYDNNLNIITEFDITTSLTTKHLGFFIVNDYIYLLYKGSLQNVFLQKMDLQGNLIFEKTLNSGGDATTDSIYKLYNAYYDKYTNTIICCYDGYTNFLITDLNGNLMKKQILNTIGASVPYENILINADNNNIYISRQGYNSNDKYFQTIEKYDKNFNFILYFCNYNNVALSTININCPIIVNDNLNDNNVYLFNKDNINGLSIYNQNGTYTNKIINSNISQIINNGQIIDNKIYVYSIIKINGRLSTYKSLYCINVLSIDNVDEPLYIIIPQISINYTPQFTFDSNNNIIYCINNTIYKTSQIKNTNPYQVFKGYKIKQ